MDEDSKSNDYELCIICQINTGPTEYTHLVMNPAMSSVTKIIESAVKRSGYGDSQFMALKTRLQGLSAEDLILNAVRYHRTCYAQLTSKTLIDRAKARFEKGTSSGSVSDIWKKRRGRPSCTDSVDDSYASKRCARDEPFDKEKCVICQDDTGAELHDVSTKNMGLQMRNIGLETSNYSLKVRLSSVTCSTDPLQAVADDIKYHLPCLVKAKRDISSSNRAKMLETSNVNFGRVLSDLEITEIVESELSNTTCTDNVAVDMNQIHVTYIDLLKANQSPVPDKPRYKEYLKQLILDNIPDVHFNRPPDRTKPELIFSTKVKDQILSNAQTENSLKDDLNVLLKAAKILRKDIASTMPWKFTGTFADYNPPPMVQTFCKFAVKGTMRLGDVNKEESIDQSSSLLAQHLVGAYKSDRQVSYKSTSQGGAFRQHRETPMSVGLALDIHKTTRSKSLVEKLAQLDLSISYKKVMEIETSMAKATLKQMDALGGICIPPWLVQDTFVWFALDNIDFLEATPSGMNTLHGTVIAIYQSESLEKSPMMLPIELDRSSKAQTLGDTVECPKLTCRKPEPEKRKSECKLSPSKPATEKYRKTDMAWIIGCLNFEEDETVKVMPNAPGTWGAFNSLLSPSCDKTNVGLVPPLIRSPPTEYDTLYTGLMRARDITKRVMGSESITVMTLDMQLYDLAMKLWVERENIRNQFLFRPGELHIVFWALSALGKYIEGSGIDQAWVEAGLYSPTTVTNILNGKQMYRSLEAHMVTLITLYNLYFQSLLTAEPEIRAQLHESSVGLQEAYKRDINMHPKQDKTLCDAVEKAVMMFETGDMAKKMEEFNGKRSKIQHFILSYMKQFETILHFIRATRQRDLQLHLESIQSLMKYFFAHDHLNYARLLPLYISTMQETEKRHPSLWTEFMRGHFCVTKGVAGFTSIASDHGIEQENRKLKVMGGIVGITQNEKALDKFFLIAPELSKALHEFSQEYGLEEMECQKQHHEITGGKLCRIMMNVSKLVEVIREHGDPFMDENMDDEVYNLLTKEVKNEKVSKDILDRDIIGQQMFEKFVTDRLTEGKLSVWDKLPKRKLKTFKSANVTAEVRSGEKLVKVKEERGLLQRFIVICRSRPELDLKQCIGTYEFGLVPRSLFAADGTLLLAYDKAKIVHHLERLTGTNQAENHTQNLAGESSMFDLHDTSDKLEEDRSSIPASNVELLAQPEHTHLRVIIIDGMALVNSMSKTDQMKTCNDFAQAFIERVSTISADYDEVRLVFDKYINSSLKDKMRQKRTKGKSTYYRVTDSTLIQNITLKNFLSNINTKAELTEYLAVKCLAYSKSPVSKLKKFLVTSGTETKGNTSIPDVLLTHSQEEADTLLILHALTVDKDAELVIDSPDTDVLILLIEMYQRLPAATSFLTGRRNLRRNIAIQPICEKLGEKCTSAMIGFHAFTGSDMSGRFAGRSKEWCFKVFLKCDSNILDALGALGQESDPSPEVCAQLERFVCLIYKSEVFTEVKDLRWFLYSNRAAEGESLPPTTGSLQLHIRRAHYIAMIWRRATESHPSLPSPTAYGWELLVDEGIYTPIRCVNPPAPEAVTNLVKCGCKKGCTGWCNCSKNNIPCTEVCGCMRYSCNNRHNPIEHLVVEEDEDDDM